MIGVSSRTNPYSTSCCNAPMCQKSLSGHIRSYCLKLIASRTNRVVMHRSRDSCSNALLCHNLLSGQIRSYFKKLIKANWQQDNSYHSATVPLRHTSPSGQIRSFWPRDVLCVLLSRYVIIGYFRNNCFNSAHEKIIGRKV